MSIQLQSLLNRLTNVLFTSSQSVWYQILGGAGAALDTVDPNQIGLADQFSVTTATGSALNKHGADWGVPRRYNETDDAYRQRILGQLPRYASGPTVANIQSVVRAFTGVNPDIFEYGPDGFTMGYSAMGAFGFSAVNETFSFLVTVYNPNNVTYNQQDLMDAVNEAKPARSSAEFTFV
ncbi:phage tail protein [Alicyclobacillus tolerans]|uniref:phage tail protein n=1 Tax=Alicyclobacillus tolerans TaxID=90970 RepID=UPI001F16DC65|nr:phage tail protein [Alicyclobacillus tolerans]MCF8566921.1 phage tail protein [Alicyclobacillus tolerans]